jgi:hypothetical protein
MKGGKIISADHCCNLGGPTNYVCRQVNIVKEYATRHSEVQAFSRIKKNIKKYRKINDIKIINFRLNSYGEIRNAKSCLACTKVLYRLGVNNIIYSTDEGIFIKEKITDVLENATYSKYSKKLMRNKN